MSADELADEVAGELALHELSAEKQAQVAWLRDYCERWDEMSEAKGEAFYNAPVVAKEEA